ncbi:Chitin recognition protein [Aspergillus sp. HF37]|nr:Chitin recognition protein [Aspergillus sp. HF37]
MGSSCQWEGFRGVGFPCSPACSDPEATIVARSTNSYGTNEAGQLADLTCTGGFQAYCCVGFVPSSITNTANLPLYGQTPVLGKRDTRSSTSGTDLSLHVRDVDATIEKRGGPLLVGGLGALCLADAPIAALLAPLTFGLSIAAEGVLCAVAAAAAAATAAIIGFMVLSSIVGWVFGAPYPHLTAARPSPLGGCPTVSGRSSTLEARPRRQAATMWSLIRAATAWAGMRSATTSAGP